nr:hypothetical protein Iba_chr04fCG5260 [Ipomoea batatas]
MRAVVLREMVELVWWRTVCRHDCYCVLHLRYLQQGAIPAVYLDVCVSSSVWLSHVWLNVEILSAHADRPFNMVLSDLVNFGIMSRVELS